MRRAEREQRPSQPARPRPDLDHGDALQRPRAAGDLRREVQVQEEVLAQRALGREVMVSDDVAQRRQAVDRAHKASRPASRSAAMRLSGRAKPRPAMSNAVPWSGEVRTKGSPSVTLTPS